MAGITLTEGIVVAIIALVAAWGGSWITAGVASRKVNQEERETEATAQAELRRDLMARIEQLQAHIAKLEERIAAKDGRIATLEGRVTELESENARLRAELARICSERAAKGAA